MARFKDHKKSAGKSKSPVRSAYQITQPRCKVCQSPSRRQIDQMLTMGMPAAHVAEHFSEIDEQKYTSKSFNNHKNKHLALKDAAIRQIVEKRAKEAGIDIDNAAESLLTSRSVLETMVHKGFESVLNGRTTVRPEDLMAALKQLQEQDEEYHDVQLRMNREEFRKELQVFIDSVRSVVPSEMHEEIISVFKANMKTIQQERDQIEQHAGD